MLAVSSPARIVHVLLDLLAVSRLSSRPKYLMKTRMHIILKLSDVAGPNIV